MSTFSGLSVGLSSLYAQRAGLELAGHNVANANTEGYSRQRVGMAADGGPITPAIHSTWDGSGNGVTITGFERMRDVFLESRALQERGTESQLATGQLVLSRVEGIMAEPSDVGIQSQLADFWAGWDDIANKPTGLAPRNQLLQRAETLAAGLNGALDGLDSQRAGFREQLVATVDEVNTTATSIAEYNRAIISATQSGSTPNDLKDQRDLLVQRLGELVGARAVQGKFGSVDVHLGANKLVDSTAAAALTVPTTTDPSSVQWTVGGATVVVGGATGGLLTGIDTVLPRYEAGLKQVMATLHDTVNTKHAEGFTPSGAPGTALFSISGGRLSVAITDPLELAASGTSGGNAGGAGALKLAGLAGQAGGADELYRGLVVKMGVEAQTANRRLDIQSSIVAQVDAARESQSGVNLDEEMTNLMAFQRAYEGSARFVSAVDSMLDTLINRTGLVGR